MKRMLIMVIPLILTSCGYSGDPYFIMQADAQYKQYKESGQQDVDRILYHIRDINSKER